MTKARARHKARLARLARGERAIDRTPRNHEVFVGWGVLWQPGIRLRHLTAHAWLMRLRAALAKKK